MSKSLYRGPLWLPVVRHDLAHCEAGRVATWPAIKVGRMGSLGDRVRAARRQAVTEKVGGRREDGGRTEGGADATGEERRSGGAEVSKS